MALQNYIEMIQNYLEGKTPISLFETNFYKLYKNDSEIPDQASELLYDFFTELDCYHADHTEEEEKADPHQVTEKTLRLKAQETLEKLKALKMTNTAHKKILEDLLQAKSTPQEIDQRIQEADLERFGVKPLVCLHLKDIQNILEKYIAGEFTSEQVEDWANLIESYDDIEYDEKDSETLLELIYFLAAPEAGDELTVEKAKELLQGLS